MYYLLNHASIVLGDVQNKLYNVRYYAEECSAGSQAPLSLTGLRSCAPITMFRKASVTVCGRHVVSAKGSKVLRREKNLKC
jgi:hypothetical protein